MYEINYKNLKKGYGFYGMFLGIGLIFTLIFGLMIFEGMIRKISMDSEVEAHKVETNVSSSSKKMKARYYYVVNGEEYIYNMIPYESLASSSELESKKMIYYKSSNPNDCVSEYETKIQLTDMFILAFVLIFPTAGITGMIEVSKEIKKVKWLSQNGTLIKGLKYELVRTGKRVNKRNVLAIQVDYELPSGSVIKLTGDPRYDFKKYDEDGLVDLLIDLENPDNYYIDFNIN